MIMAMNLTLCSSDSVLHYIPLGLTGLEGSRLYLRTLKFSTTPRRTLEFLHQDAS